MRQGTIILMAACGLALAFGASCSDETETDGTTTSTSGTGGSTTSSGTGGSTGGGGSTSTSGTGGSTSTSGTGGGGGGVGGGGDSGVDCDGTTCGPNDVCCAVGGIMSCSDSQDCGGIQIHCDNPGDCPGEICCFQSPSFQCVQSCPGQNNEVCDGDEDCTGGTTNCCPYILNTSLPTVCGYAPCD